MNLRFADANNCGASHEEIVLDLLIASFKKVNDVWFGNDENMIVFMQACSANIFIDRH